MKNLLIIISLFCIANTDSGYETYYRIACHEDEWITKVESESCKCFASSTKEKEGVFTYRVVNVLDKNKETAWVPKQGKLGNGVYEFIIMKIPYGIKGIKIVNGLAKDDFLFHANNRVKSIYLGFIAKLDPSEEGACPSGLVYHLTYHTLPNQLVSLKDTYKTQEIFFTKAIPDFDWKDCYNFKYKNNVYLVIGIWDIYKGTKFNDTCISEIEIIK